VEAIVRDEEVPTEVRSISGCGDAVFDFTEGAASNHDTLRFVCDQTPVALQQGEVLKPHIVEATGMDNLVGAMFCGTLPIGKGLAVASALPDNWLSRFPALWPAPAGSPRNLWPAPAGSPPLVRLSRVKKSG
jgi:hypothetical protein